MLQNKIRQAVQGDHPILLALWQHSVKATHSFLTEQDIEKLYQGLKNEWLAQVELWVLLAQDEIVGFIGLNDNNVEMLFIDDKHQGNGYGKQLLNFVKQRYLQIYLDVNEQNPHALRFYQKQGFEIVGRSELDGQGNPFPLLHLAYQAT
ncbi:GNAT family N-acetyltransferase [Orbus sturtevantii]|uniref:GNAT family N-acetyltransferase n=1 Tax=Orbus sturtevantii TaxID=3074109 RepID=UPI00370D8E29